MFEEQEVKKGPSVQRVVIYLSRKDDTFSCFIQHWRFKDGVLTVITPTATTLSPPVVFYINTKHLTL